MDNYDATEIAYKNGYAAAMATIVRCKDCKYAVLHEIFPNSRRCEVEDYKFPHKKTHFCSYGVPR